MAWPLALRAVATSRRCGYGIAMRYFNTAGPCIESVHYMLPPEARLPTARALVERGEYFVVHAPRQTGKTTWLQTFSESLTAEGRFAALAFSCETAETAGDDLEAAQRAMLHQMYLSARLLLPAELRPPPLQPSPSEGMLTDALVEWSLSCPRPLVLFFDEIDAIRGESLRSVLRQLRASFPKRHNGFPWSVVLCGLRDVRDYKAASGGDPNRLGTSSPFNIKVESLRLGNFEPQDIPALYGQHTAETGQAFSDEALALAIALSGGQPWLVNALAKMAIEKVAEPGVTITAEHMEQASEQLILQRATHLDSLVARLMEPRVRRVVEALLAGTAAGGDAYDDDVQYLRDLGLVAPRDPLRIANPIYKEIIVRVLALPASGNISVDPPRFVHKDGTLDMQLLLTEFADFWREQGEAIVPKLPYHEVAAQLVLLAFLQRVVNGGGIIDREYGVGRGRIDVLVRWPHPDADGRRSIQREALELKVHRDGQGDPTPEGLRQLERYLEQVGTDHGWLVVFDRRSTAPPMSDRIRFEHARTPERGLAVVVLHA